ncbi:MAG: polysaccharide deacetylase family protein [Pseudohongiellaceae bacterium]
MTQLSIDCQPTSWLLAPVVSVALTVLLVLPAVGFAADDVASSGVIVVYHHVAEDTPPSTTISPDDFRGHLVYLRNNGYVVLRLDDMVGRLRGGEGLPDRAVAITFDDGYISIYETAFPLLQEFDMPFALFVSTEPVDGRRPGYMNWEQIREMSDAGVLIANHTLTHAHLLEQVPGETDGERLARVRREIVAAEERITAETGQAWRYLAYPYGEYDPQIKALLAELGFTGFAQNSGAVGVAADFFALPRYPLAGIYANLGSAATKLESLAFAITRLSPESPVTQLRNPVVRLQFDIGNSSGSADGSANNSANDVATSLANYTLSAINCFLNNKPVPLNWINRAEGIVELAPEEEAGGRRWNYTCTARANDSRRYYWYSVPWFNPDIPE